MPMTSEGEILLSVKSAEPGVCLSDQVCLVCTF